MKKNDVVFTCVLVLSIITFATCSFVVECLFNELRILENDVKSKPALLIAFYFIVLTIFDLLLTHAIHYLLGCREVERMLIQDNNSMWRTAVFDTYRMTYIFAIKNIIFVFMPLVYLIKHTYCGTKCIHCNTLLYD